MGQQQLLLLVLSAIIVGVAIVVGINLFATSAVNANIDAVTNDCATIASRAQEWYRKPAVLGGGGQAFTGVDALAAGIYTELSFPQTNENGTYVITVGAADSLNIQGVGVEDGDGDGNNITVTMTAGPNAITSTTVTD